MLKSSLKNSLITLSLLFSSLMSADEIGSLLFHGNCITCHGEHKSISAPSITRVKENYQRAFAKKEDFIEYMSKWVEHPNEQTSIMLEDIKKYELMPELGFDRSTLEIIAAYIYETDFSKKHEGHKK